MRGSRGMRHRALIGGLVAAACCGVAATAMAGDTYVAWKRQLGTSDYDYASGVATDAAGNVYLSGSTYGSLGGANKGGADAWVMKLDADGHPLWKRQLGSPRDDSASGVATDAAGNVYLAGQTSGSLGGAFKGDWDAFVAKYAADGHPLWKRQLGTPNYDVAIGVATDAAGNVYLAGSTWGSLGGAKKGDGDAFVVKYAADGHPLWKRQLGTVAVDNANGVATDAAGNVYLTGSTTGSLGGPFKGGYWDAWVMKLDTDGHRLWARQPGTADNEGARDMATDAAGNVYLTGSTYGSLGGANKGRTDAWVMKISPTAESAEEPTNGPAD